MVFLGSAWVMWLAIIIYLVVGFFVWELMDEKDDDYMEDITLKKVLFLPSLLASIGFVVILDWVAGLTKGRGATDDEEK